MVKAAMLGLAVLFAMSVPVAAGAAAPTVRIRLPERFRLLTGQYFDLRVEATGLTDPGTASIKILVDGNNVTAQLPAPQVSTDNDTQPADLDKAWTFRKVSFPTPGARKIEAIVTDGGVSASDVQDVGVLEFKLNGRKNIVLFIGDAMGTAYRDAGRIVAKSVNHGFREGFFDELQEMDRMPVSGMVMTYAMDNVVPDSANTATAWSSGSKTINGALNVFPDNTDKKATGNQATKQFALDNPRIETLWEYLRRLHGYRTGIVTTADVTDATPAGEGAHSINRNLLYDIAAQYVDGCFVPGPAFDVILGGGKERFVTPDLVPQAPAPAAPIGRNPANSSDNRNLVAELQAKGYTYVQNRTELLAVPGSVDKLIGLFRTTHMNVAYDKLGLVRPADEETPNFSGYTNQPFLDEMTTIAIQALANDGKPFILMVEGASIDKQSHTNHLCGTIWDTIEFDKAVGVGRRFAALDEKDRDRSKTLVLVSADHDQSMSIIGVTDSGFVPPAPLPAPPVPIPFPVENTRSALTYPVVNPPVPPSKSTSGLTNPGEVDGFPDYADADADGYPENGNRFKIAVGFRSGNHCGSSVPLTAEGPGALLFTGYYDQTDIFFKMAKVLSMDTGDLDQCMKEVQRSQPKVEKSRFPRLHDLLDRSHVDHHHD